MGVGGMGLVTIPERGGPGAMTMVRIGGTSLVFLSREGIRCAHQGCVELVGMGIVGDGNLGSLPKGSQQGWVGLAAMDGVSSKSLGALPEGRIQTRYRKGGVGLHPTFLCGSWGIKVRVSVFHGEHEHFCLALPRPPFCF